MNRHRAWMVSAFGIVAALTAVPVGAQAQPQGRAVQEIPYVTCDGSRWRASLSGERFRHRPESGAAGHSDRIIHYRSWGGQCWEASWNSFRRRFDHTPVGGGETHADTILNFEDWDGARWTARRDGDDWVVTPG